MRVLDRARPASMEIHLSGTGFTNSRESATGYLFLHLYRAKGVSMTKADLINKMANDANISKSAATAALSSLLDGITSSLARGTSVTLVGFGSFAVSSRAARTGRNPKTGAPIQIAAAKVPRFKAGRSLKDSVNR